MLNSPGMKPGESSRQGTIVDVVQARHIPRALGPEHSYCCSTRNEVTLARGDDAWVRPSWVIKHLPHQEGGRRRNIQAPEFRRPRVSTICRRITSQLNWVGQSMQERKQLCICPSLCCRLLLWVVIKRVSYKQEEFISHSAWGWESEIKDSCDFIRIFPSQTTSPLLYPTQ